MENANDTFYCSFVSTHYIVCECGETFPSEDLLKLHLEKGHKYTKKQKKEKVVIVQQAESLGVNDEAPKVLVYSDSQPLQLNGRPVYIIKNSSNRKQELVVPYPTDEVFSTLEGHLEMHHADEIKEEIIYEMPADDDGAAYIMPTSMLQEDTPDPYETVVTCKNHLYRDHNYEGDVREEEYFCGFCGKSFASAKAVRHHRYRMHQLSQEERDQRSDGKKTVCEVCGKKSASGKSFGSGQCYKCRKPQLSQQKHYQRSNAKKWHCEVCDKAYCSSAALRYHQRTHTGEKPYPCTECPKRFSMPLFLQIHLRTHTGERPYECKLCPKAFSSKAALLRHDRVHTGEKPYACPECGKTFSQSNSMKLHVRTVHLKLPTPYKSKARRLKALRRAQGSEEPQETPYILPTDDEAMLYETIDATRSLLA